VSEEVARGQGEGEKTPHTGCVFCEIVEGRAPADIVYHDELTIAVVDPRQHNAGHVLVIPKKHLNDVRELDERTGSAVMRTIVEIARAVDRAFPNEGMTVWYSVGPAAFQEVPHLHVHVHPRRLGDGLLRVYPDAPVDADPPSRAEYAERIRVALARQA
jgi:histidine triad (HIT) family protein